MHCELFANFVFFKFTPVTHVVLFSQVHILAKNRTFSVHKLNRLKRVDTHQIEEL